MSGLPNMQETSVAPAGRSVAAVPLPRIDAPALGLIITILIAGALALLKSTDPDYWWHLRTGQLIAQTHAVPTVDSYSFTANGKAWLAHEWLSELVIYGLDQTGGYALSILVFIAVAAGSLWLGFRTAVALGASRWAALGTFIWATFMFGGFWVVRPQVFSWLFLSLFLAIIVEHQRGKASLWPLPPLTVIWVNLHLGVMFGLAMVGLYAVSLWVERLLWQERRDVKQAFAVLAGCIIATALTPQPGAMLLYPLRYIRPGNWSLRNISEWQSPNFHSLDYLPLALGLLFLVAVGAFDRKRGLFFPLVTLLFAALALQSVRNIPLFAVVFMVVAAARASDLWHWAAADPKRVQGTVHSAINLAFVAAMAAVMAFAVSRYPNQLHHAALTKDYPAAGVEYVLEHEPESNVYATYHWGGFVIDKLPDSRVFVDGRSEFYGDDLLNTYDDVMNVSSGWQQILDRYGANVIIVEKNAGLAGALDKEPGWSRAFTGPIEAVFVRKSN